MSNGAPYHSAYQEIKGANLLDKSSIVAVKFSVPFSTIVNLVEQFTESKGVQKKKKITVFFYCSILSAQKY